MTGTKSTGTVPDQHHSHPSTLSSPPATSNESTSPTAVDNKQPKTPETSTTSEDPPIEDSKELTTLERIKAEREYEKANPKKPLMEAEGMWRSRLWVIPTALLYGFGGGGS